MGVISIKFYGLNVPTYGLNYKLRKMGVAEIWVSGRQLFPSPVEYFTMICVLVGIFEHF